MNIRLGLRLPPCRPIGELVSFAQKAEAVGIDTLWLPDSQLLWRDPFVAIGAIAGQTSRIRLATGVTNVRTRHFTVLASLTRTIAEMAPGRFMLGMGAGASSIRPIGMQTPNNSELEAAINHIRDLCCGDSTSSDGEDVVMRDPPGPVPVILAATGPRRLGLAGRCADGVMLHRGTTPALIEPAVEAVIEGARSAGRTPGRIQTVVTGAALFTDDIERDAEQFLPICITMLQDGGASVLARAGVLPVEPRESVAGLGDLKHAENWSRAVAAAAPGMGPQAARTFVDQFCFAGSPDELAGRITTLEKVGVTEVMLQDLSSFQLPERLLEGMGQVRAAMEKAHLGGPLTETPRLT